MGLTPPTKVGKLRAALHAKAKRLPDYRFYALYDKLYREDVLRHAYRICHVNGGACGVDGQTFEDIEDYGRGRDDVPSAVESGRWRRFSLTLPSGCLLDKLLVFYGFIQCGFEYPELLVTHDPAEVL